MIVVSFTPKNQDVSRIIEILKAIQQNNPGQVLMHGFMPRSLVEEKGLSTEIVDALDALFPTQLCVFKANGVDRELMVQVAKNENAQIYVIGDIVDGVLDEVVRFVQANLRITYIHPERGYNRHVLMGI